jgi:uncharacterized lipoprotein YmbA
MTRPAMRLPALAALAAAALLAACSTPPDHFHTLRPALASTQAGTPGSAREVGRVLAIGPVTVPQSLARNEWVVRTGATGAQVYDHQLWTQDLGADVAQSVVDYLDRAALPDGLRPDAGPTGSGSGADLERPATLRVRLQVLRLDSVLAPAPAVSDQLRWTLECLPSDPALGPVDAGRYRVLRSAVREVAGPAPAADTALEESQQRFDRVARAHSDAVRQLADDIAAALRASADQRARDCVVR